MKQLVIGLGEVGQALYNVLNDTYGDTIFKRDLEAGDLPETFEVLHICIPFTDGFVDEVKAYQAQYKPSLTIIHSTVSLGTSDLCGAVHSPVRGVHPYLVDGLRTFVKYFGGSQAFDAARIFSSICPVFTTDKAKNTEAGKMWCTTQYFAQIDLEKNIHKYCKDNDLDFDFVYTHLNQTYNEGYEKLGMKHVVRSIIQHVPGPIGGHCVVSNAKLLAIPYSYRLLKRDKTYD